MIRALLLVVFWLAAAPAYAQQAVRIAVIMAPESEAGWDRSLIAALERTRAARPFGLDLEWRVETRRSGERPPDLLRRLAARYDIVWAHTHYSDAVAEVQDAAPATLFVVAGYGNAALGGNQLWVMKRLHEPAWLLGVLAGRLTESGVLGVTATVPVEDVNDAVNAFRAGARHARSDIKVAIDYIEAWHDRARAAAATRAQAAAGADLVFQLAPAYAVCAELKILCLGAFTDDHAGAPQALLSSALALWDPDIAWAIETWRAGPPFEGNRAERRFGMAEGGADLAPFHGLAARGPREFQAEIARLAHEIRDGRRVIAIDAARP